MRFNYLGHACWLLEASGLRIALDPLLGDEHAGGVFEVVPKRRVDPASDEVVPHGAGPALGEILVVGLAAGGVGVPLHDDGGLGELEEDGSRLVERGAGLSGEDRRIDGEQHVGLEVHEERVRRDPLDRRAGDLPQLRLLAIHVGADAGAYGRVMASSYNLRELPREEVLE